MPPMPFIPPTCLATGVTALSECLATDAEHGHAVAASGTFISAAMGGGPFTGAVIGGAAGYLCRDLNVPGCRNN